MDLLYIKGEIKSLFEAHVALGVVFIAVVFIAFVAILAATDGRYEIATITTVPRFPRANRIPSATCARRETS